MATYQNPFAPEKSTFEKIIDGIDKPDAIARAYIGKALGDASAPSPDRILHGKDTYSIQDLKAALERRTGTDLTFGEGKDTNMLQSAGNFAVDALASMALSPISYITGGLSKAVKASGLGTKAVTSAMKAAENSRYHKAATKIGAYLNSKGRADRMAAGAAVGGTYGALTGDDTEGAMSGAAIGALTGGLGPQALALGGRAIGKVGNEIIDNYVRGAHPDIFKNTDLSLSKSVEIARDARTRYADIPRKIRSHDEAFYNMDEKHSELMQDLIDRSFAKSISYRNHLTANHARQSLGIKNIEGLDALNLGPNRKYYVSNATQDKLGTRFVQDADSGVVYGFDKDGKLTNKTSLKNATRVDTNNINSDEMVEGMCIRGDKTKAYKMSRDLLNDFNRRTNSYVGSMVDKELRDRNDPYLTEMVEKYRKRNQAIMHLYESKRKGIGNKDYHYVPLDFHTMEVNTPTAEQLRRGELHFDNLTEGFVKRTKDHLDNTANLTFQERLNYEADHFINNVLTKKEKEAMRIISRIASEREANPTTIRKLLRKWDAFTGFLKQQQLTFAHSWTVNNFTENLIKAYIAGGLENAMQVGKRSVKSAFFRSSGGDDLIEDMLKLTNPKNSGPIGVSFKTDIAKLGIDYGVVADDFFTEAFKNNRKEYLEALIGKDRAAKIIKQNNPEGLKKIYATYQDALRATIGRSGSLIEQSARLTTFQNLLKQFIEDPELLKASVPSIDKGIKAIKSLGLREAARTVPEARALVQKAAQVTNDTFFDYGNVSLFESEVMKRIIPYYTFASRNLLYWTREGLQDNNVGRTARALGLVEALGEEPTSNQRATIPDYLLSQGVRVGKGGKLVTMPALSAIDAFKTFEDPVGSVAEKLHPGISTAKAIATGRTNLGSALYPSGTAKGEVRTSSPLLDAIVPDSLSKVSRNPTRGNTKYTRSDLYALLSLAKNNLLPAPLIDTILRAIEQEKTGTDVSDTLASLGPTKIKELRPDERIRTLRRRVAEFKKKQHMDKE